MPIQPSNNTGIQQTLALKVELLNSLLREEAITDRLNQKPFFRISASILSTSSFAPQLLQPFAHEDLEKKLCRKRLLK